MDFTGDWNNSRPTGDWNDSRPQRPLNLDSFDFGEDIANWNQPPLLQHADVVYAPRTLRGPTQQDRGAGELRSPFQTPLALNPSRTEGVSNNDSERTEMSEQINALDRKYQSQLRRIERKVDERMQATDDYVEQVIDWIGECLREHVYRRTHEMGGLQPGQDEQGETREES